MGLSLKQEKRAAGTVVYACLFMGFVYVVVGAPLALGKIGRNTVYGVRIPAAFASEEAWLRINQVGGLVQCVMGLWLLFLGALLLRKFRGAEKVETYRNLFLNGFLAVILSPMFLVILLFLALKVWA